jgi:hypothetical protein
MRYVEWVDEWMNTDRLHPTYFYSGPWDAKIVVVGQELAEGGTQPFQGMHDTYFAWESLGPVALELGWTAVQEVPPQLLRDRHGIISCGKRAGNWVQYVVNGDIPVLMLPSPKYLFTRGTDSETQSVCNSVKLFVENNLNKRKDE